MFLRKPGQIVVALTSTMLLVANSCVKECGAGPTRRETRATPSSIFNVGDQWLTKTSIGGPVHIEPALLMRKDVDSSKYAIEPVAGHGRSSLDADMDWRLGRLKAPARHGGECQHR
ncbi:MAG: hypothetical protein JWP89_4103 [Schlesneria sp.]|nr:hypothetical protein [Schlesneria sp.]